MQMQSDSEQTISEYRSSFIWKSPKSAQDGYEKIVQQMIHQSPKPSPHAAAADPFEEMVQRKIKEVPFSESAMNIVKSKFEETAVLSPKKESAPEPAKTIDTQKHQQAAPKEEVQMPTHIDEPIKAAIKRQQKHERKSVKTTRRVPKSQRFISSENEKSISTPRVHVYRPTFFADPDNASDEQKKDLFGPFWVCWPKNKPLPKKYKELAEVMEKKH